MVQSFLSGDSLGRVAFEAFLQENNCLFLLGAERCNPFALPITSSAVGGPKNNLLETVAALAVAWDVRFKDLAMQECCFAHPSYTKDVGEFEQSVYVVGAMKEGEAATEERQ